MGTERRGGHDLTTGAREGIAPYHMRTTDTEKGRGGKGIFFAQGKRKRGGETTIPALGVGR